MVSVITFLLALGLVIGPIGAIVIIGERKNGLFKAILIPMITAGMCYYTITYIIPFLQPTKAKTQTLPQVLQTLHNTTKMCVKENLNLIKTKQDVNSYNFNNCKIATSDNILSCTCKMKAYIPKNIIYAQSTCSNQNNTIKCNTEYQITHKQHESSPDTLANVIIIILLLFMMILLILAILCVIEEYEKKEAIALLVSTVITIIGTICIITYFILAKYHHVL